MVVVIFPVPQGCVFTPVCFTLFLRRIHVFVDICVANIYKHMYPTVFYCTFVKHLVSIWDPTMRVYKKKIYVILDLCSLRA